MIQKQKKNQRNQTHNLIKKIVITSQQARCFSCKAYRLSYVVSVSSLKAVLSAPLSSGALDLSGIPLTVRDMERLCSHLQRHSSTVVSLELGFTELTDEAFLLLLPTLAALPHLETLALNGNRLTRTILKELTDALKVRTVNVFIYFYSVTGLPCICVLTMSISLLCMPPSVFGIKHGLHT